MQTKKRKKGSGGTRIGSGAPRKEKTNTLAFRVKEELKVKFLEKYSIEERKELFNRFLLSLLNETQWASN